MRKAGLAETVPPSGAQEPPTVGKTALLTIFKKIRVLYIFVGFTGLVLNIATSLTIPYVSGLFIDQVSEGNISEEFIILIFVIFIMNSVFNGFQQFFFAYSGEEFGFKLKSSLFEVILNKEIMFFDSAQTGELVSRFISDTSLLQSLVSKNFSNGLRYILTIFGSLIILLLISWKLTLAIILVVPVVFLTGNVFGNKLKKLARASKDGDTYLNKEVTETLSYIRTVKIFSGEEYEISKLRKNLISRIKLYRKLILFQSAFSSAIEFVSNCMVVAVLWFGGTLVMNNEISVGTLTAFLIYVLGMSVSIASLVGLINVYQKTIAATQRILGLLRSYSAPKPPKPPLFHVPAPEDALKYAIEFNKISFSYPTRPDTQVIKLEKVSLKILPSSFVAFIGESGGGKSTIANLLIRFYDVDSGRIFINGIDIKDFDTKELRRIVSVVPQDPELFSGSIEENIRYSKQDSSLDEIVKVAKKACIYDFIVSLPLGFATRVGERGVQLSGGQKQRIAIARALLRNPEILILDEATSALDTETEEIIKKTIENTTNCTKIVIAHRLSTVEKADAIIKINNGKIIN